MKSNISANLCVFSFVYTLKKTTLPALVMKFTGVLGENAKFVKAVMTQSLMASVNMFISSFSRSIFDSRNLVPQEASCLCV